jgi:glutathione S-transferase
MSNDQVTFYYNPMSRGRTVHWMLEELQIPYETKMMKWETGDHKKPEYLAINPMGKIPAITHKGVVVTEVPAILAYLADAFPQARLAPDVHSADRGPYYRWLFYAAANVEPAMVDQKHPRVNAPPASHLGHGRTEDVINTLEKAVSKGYLVGDRFTAADLFMSSTLGWFMFTGMLEKRPAFTRYVGLCQDRPSYRRHMEKSAMR